MFDVVALGECLIDCTPAGKNEMGMSLFSSNPGGAPANVLAMNAKLGGTTAFIGKVGRDAFGEFLKNTMDEAGVDTCGLCMSDEYKTTLAFVQLDDKGERSFSFYRKPGADVMLTTGEVNTSLLMSCKIFHFGSVSLTDEPCRTTTLHAVRIAKESGALISYDPNYRPALWESPEEAKKVLTDAVFLSDLLKVSDEEMTLLTGETDFESGAKKLAAMGPPVVMVTMGEKGSFFYTPAGSGYVPAFQVKTTDTTGAGDAFLGALHNCIQKKSLQELVTMEPKEWISVMKFASAAGGLTATQKGAIPAMPERSEILALMQNSV
jgi:fructokinase